MLKKAIKCFSFLISLCLAINCCFIPAAAVNSITITLDNGEYNQTYKDTYGVIEYSTDDGATFKQIDDGTIIDGRDYTVSNVSSIKVRTTITAPNNYNAFIIGSGPNIQFNGNNAEQINDNVHLEFRSYSPGPDPGPNPSNGITISLDNGIYDSSYISTYGTIQYSVDNGESWTELNIGTEASGTNYTVTDAIEILVRATIANSENYSAFVIGNGGDLQLGGTDGTRITESVHLEFRGAVGPNMGDIVITLDDGVYDSTYTEKFGTITYSTDGGTTWESIDSIPNQNGNTYIFTESESVKIKVTTVDKQIYTPAIATEWQDFVTKIEEDIATDINESCHIDFISVKENILDNGASIRVASNEASQAIRIKTGIHRHLLDTGYFGYSVCEYGSILALSEGLGDNELVMNKYMFINHTRVIKGVAYSKESNTERLFSEDEFFKVYSLALTGIDENKYATEYTLRPYIILKNESGDIMTVYGEATDYSIFAVIHAIELNGTAEDKEAANNILAKSENVSDAYADWLLSVQ